MNPAELAHWILHVLVPFCFGACIGSFLNVCIYRMPLMRSLIHPGSHCAACGAPIPWYHNIPIFNWFYLRGKTACCGSKLDLRYAVVEALAALLAVVLWNRYPMETATLYYLFCCLLLIGTFIDLDHFIIPDEVTLGSCVLGLVFSFCFPQLQDAPTGGEALKQSFIGLVAGGGLLWGIATLGSIVLRKEAMGFGDVKLLAGMGAFYGWEAVPYIIGVSSLLGSLIGIGVMLCRQKRWGIKIPFGPFLALAALTWLFGGRDWMMNYLDMVRGGPGFYP